MMGSLRAFSAQLPESEADADLTRSAIHYLETPATRKWVAGRMLTLLSHYFVAQQEAAVTEAMAEDWCAILEGCPAWALANASRWWLSRDNPRKHLKPLPGDIQERAHAEAEPIRAARITLRRGIAVPAYERDDARPAVEPGDLERRREFAASIGLKRFGGDQA